jgi:hypothetical protein
MSVRRCSLALAAITLAACSTDPASPVADGSALRPDAAPSFALAAGSNTSIVTGADVVSRLHGASPAPSEAWTLYTRGSGAGTFVSGPGTAPIGVGSLQLATPLDNDKAYLFNYDHQGTPLSDITAISYRTYRTSGSAEQVAALNIEVDVNGAADGGYTVLVFEPVYNTVQGTVQNGVWQRWDAFRGGQATWWSSRAIPGVCAFGCYVSWADIVAANPSAVIVGGFGVNQGGGNPTLNSAVDALTLGVGTSSITYDFEPYRVAASLGDCKNGGWKNVKRANGSAFKNQGECVAYVDNL